MPNYAYLNTKLKCPKCGVIVTDFAAFQWGLCPGYGPRAGYVYHIGDEINWRCSQSGVSPSWTYFGNGEGNIGNPAVKDLFVQEEFQFYWDESHPPNRCSSCECEFEGAIIEIRKGCLVDAWIYQKGDFDHNVSYFVVVENGELLSRPEWNDHQMPIIEK